ERRRAAGVPGHRDAAAGVVRVVDVSGERDRAAGAPGDVGRAPGTVPERARIRDVPGTGVNVDRVAGRAGDASARGAERCRAVRVEVDAGARAVRGRDGVEREARG